MAPANQQKLSGDFIECCDCYTICPCWVSERPDEDHCSALYVWTFAKGSVVEGHDIGGKSVVAASYHGNRGGTQSALYVDDSLDLEKSGEPLLALFSGGRGGTLGDLANLLGTIVVTGQATIDRTPAAGQEWQVTVTVDGSRLALGRGQAAEIKGEPDPIVLGNTALHKELKLVGLVTVQTVDRFEFAVSPLPAGPFVYAGRSGMMAHFDYSRPQPHKASKKRQGRELEERAEAIVHPSETPKKR